MTLPEMSELIAKINAIYPDMDRYKSDSMLIAKVRLWAAYFRDDPVELVNAAVDAYVVSSTENYAPNPGQIKEMMVQMLPGNDLSEAEAWAKVLKALRNSIYNSLDEFKKLPIIVQKAVGDPGQLRAWAMLEGADNLSVAEALFKRAYRTECQRDAVRAKIPKEILTYIESLETPIIKAIDPPQQEAQTQDAPAPRSIGINRKALEAAKESLIGGLAAGSEKEQRIDSSKKEEAIEKLKRHLEGGDV